MIRSSRTSFAPLAFLIAFEIGAILVLQRLGASASMQVEWGDFAAWLNANPLEITVPALVRVVALAVAYWMFLSTALFVCAQISRIPAAVRATSLFTLPSVRRVVDASMAVTIATTAVIGVSGTSAMAAPAAATATQQHGTQHQGDGRFFFDTSISTSSSLISSTESAAPVVVNNGNASVATPSVNNAGANNEGAAPLAGSDTPAPATNPGQATNPAPATPESTTSTSTSTSTSAAPAASGTMIIEGSGTAGAVPTPRPGAPLSTAESAAQAQAASPSTTWTIPSAGTFTVGTPKPGAAANTAPTPAPSTSNTGGTQVLGVAEHRVVKGENLWTISRDALMDANGGKAPSETEVRDYWLKVIDANRDNLRSKDPHWIFAGEVISLPAQ